MAQGLYYLSFDQSLTSEKQVAFCQQVEHFIGEKVQFYDFSDEVKIVDDHEVSIPLDQMAEFFELIGKKEAHTTFIFNHAIFHPYLKQLAADGHALIYHKTDIEYLFLKKSGIERDVVEAHRKLEKELMVHCDWLYAHSETLLDYFRENDGYHQHKYSVLPYPVLDLLVAESTVNSTVNYLHIGAVNNRGLRYTRKILEASNAQLTVLGDEPSKLRPSEKCHLLPFNMEVLAQQLSQVDYVLVRPKSDPLEWIRIEQFLLEALRFGAHILIPREFISLLPKAWQKAIHELEECDFNNMPKVTNKDLIKELVNQYLSTESDIAELKLRNLKNHFENRVGFASYWKDN